MPEPSSIPIDDAAVLDLYFLEHRAKLIDIAAFLDRIDRTNKVGEQGDFRFEAIRGALAILQDGQGQRTRRILQLLSDPTIEPIASAAGIKGARGAWTGLGATEQEVRS